jgi:hypothetical protein
VEAAVGAPRQEEAAVAAAVEVVEDRRPEVVAWDRHPEVAVLVAGVVEDPHRRTAQTVAAEMEDEARSPT